MKRRLAATATALALAIPVVLTAAASTSEAESSPLMTPVTATGVLGGDAAYSLIRPSNWNGDLLVMPGRDDLDDTTVDWLTAHGFGVIGYDLSSPWDLESDRRNAGRAVATFTMAAGKPDDIVVSGRSQGGLTTRIVAESRPEWLDGSVPMCGGGAGAISMWNYKLDTAFALRELVDPQSGLQITRIDDAEREQAILDRLLADASSTAAGRARLVLAAALGRVPAVDPVTGKGIPDRDLAQRTERYLAGFPFAVGASVRTGYESTVGGSFSWNTGVDYTRELRTSGRWAEVVRAYRAAGADLGQDLDTLAGAARMTADEDVVRFVEKTATFTGRLSAPVLTLHTTGDPGGPTTDEAAYAASVRAGGSAGLLRQSFVGSEGHCTFTSAEEVTALVTMFDRIDDGRWPATSSRALDRRAARVATESSLDLGGARFTSADQGERAPRTWDSRDWGRYSSVGQSGRS
ncbi:alpha/beta hydrolase [Nocardioides insulae]|uniref:alpha/beta hydrolase n=1 Tax=Nocardioides insulae TaxID=394734 RepID=UPI00040431BE|nr:alpha/beta hydrolase [Nocardioides insulae]